MQHLALARIPSSPKAEPLAPSAQVKAAAFDQIADAVLAVDFEGRIVLWNPQAERLFGLTQDAALGRAISSILSCTDEEFVQKAVSGFWGTECCPHETWATTRSGARLYVDCRLSLLRDASGDVTGIVGSCRDVTDRKRFEEALRFVAQRSWPATSEEFFASLVKELAATLGVEYALICRLAEGGRCADAVACYAGGAVGGKVRYDLAGAPCETVAGRGPCCYPQGVRARFPQNALLAEMKAESYAGVPLWRADGSPIGVLSVLDTRPFADPEAVNQLLQVVAMRAAAELERLESAERLRAAEGRASALMNASTESMLMLDLDYRVLFVNEAAARRLGAPVSEILGRPILSFFSPEVADGRQKFYDQVVREGAPARFQDERIGLKFDHNVFPVRGPSGEVTALAVFSLDVSDKVRAEAALQEAHAELERRVQDRTERLASAVRRYRESEEKYRSLTESISDVVFSTDDLGRLTYLSPRIADFGVSAERYLGRCVYELVDARDQQEVAENFERLAEEGKATVSFRLNRDNGREVWLKGRADVRHDPSGVPKGMTGVLRDVTQEREASEELRQSREQLRALAAKLETVREEERARVSRELHDELGQTLTGLKMQVRRLISLAQQAAREKRCDEAALESQVQGINEIVDGTIDTVLRLTSELRPGILDDLGFVAALEWLLADCEKRTGLACRLETELSDIELDEKHSTTAFRLVQEALTNVARHAEAKSVTVKLCQDGDAVRLEVLDDGKGIPSSALAGTGALGLLGMRERATALGGSVEVAAGQRRGTRVSIALPRA